MKSDAFKFFGLVSPSVAVWRGVLVIFEHVRTVSQHTYDTHFPWAVDVVGTTVEWSRVSTRLSPARWRPGRRPRLASPQRK